MVVLRISTKHINLWMRQLEMKRKEMSELAGLIGLQEVKKEISEEKSLERWARRCSNFFTKKVRRMLFEEIDNMVWSGNEDEITGWCNRNKVYEEITDNEIEEIWKSETQDDEEAIRLKPLICIGDSEEGVRIHKRTRGHHPDHDIWGVPSCDEEGDECHQRSPQCGEEEKADLEEKESC